MSHEEKRKSKKPELTPEQQAAKEKRNELINELRSATCFCGSNKRRNQSLCAACFNRLPKSKKNALYKRIGHGYAEARDDAVAYLEKSK